MEYHFLAKKEKEGERGKGKKEKKHRNSIPPFLPSFHKIVQQKKKKRGMKIKENIKFIPHCSFHTIFPNIQSSTL